MSKQAEDICQAVIDGYWRKPPNETELVAIIDAELKKARNEALETGIVALENCGLEKESLVRKVVRVCQDRLRALKEQ